MGNYSNNLAFVPAYARWVVKHPYVVFVLSLLLMVGVGSGMARLEFSTDYREYFSPDNPQIKTFENFQRTYGNGDFTYFAISPKTITSDNAFSATVLSATRDLTREAWKLPFSMRVESVTNFQNIDVDGDDLSVMPLLPDDVEITAERIEKLRKVALQDLSLRNSAVSSDGHIFSVRVVTEMPALSLFELPTHVKEARALRDRILAAYPDVNIHMSGTNMMSNAFNEAAIHDSLTLIPLMYVLILAIIYFMLRSGYATLSTLLVLNLSSAFALGAAGHIGILLTSPSMLSPLAITTLAVADCLHVSLAASALIRKGVQKDEAIIGAVVDNLGPITLTGITTAVGFLTMNFMDSPPLGDLGNIAAIGVLIASFWSVFLLPALLVVLPMRIREGRANLLEKFVIRLGDGVLAYPRSIMIVTLIVGLLLSFGLLRNQAADNFNNYFDSSIEFGRDNDFINRHIAGTFYVDFSLDSGRPDGMTDPSVLAKVEDFANWWRGNEKVTYVASITDVYKRINKSMHSDDPAWYRLPETQTLASQLLLLYEMSLPFGMDLNNQIDVNKSATRLTVFMKADHINDFTKRVQEGEAWLNQNAAEFMAYSTGVTTIFSRISDKNIRSMLPQAITMFLVMSAVLVFCLRSLRFGLLSIVTLVLPVSIAFGIWGLISGEINFTMASAIGLVTGICDDDTVHFLNSYLGFRRRHGLDQRDALRETFNHCGASIFATTAVLVAGFLVMAQSAFLPNSGMAKLACMSFTAALFLNLLLLPGMILLVDRESF